MTNKKQNIRRIKSLTVQVKLTFSGKGIRKTSAAEVVTRVVDAIRNQMDGAGTVPDDEGEYTIKIEVNSTNCSSDYEIPKSQQ